MGRYKVSCWWDSTASAPCAKVSRTSSFFSSLREICCANAALLRNTCDSESYHTTGARTNSRPGARTLSSRDLACKTPTRKKNRLDLAKRGPRSRLYLGDLLSLRALGTLTDLELHKLSFVQRLVSIHFDGGEVNEDVLSRLTLNEPKSF